MFDQGIPEWLARNAGLVVGMGGLLFFLFGIFGDPEKRTSLEVLGRKLFSIPPVEEKYKYILIAVGLVMAVGGLWLFSENWPPSPGPPPTDTPTPTVAEATTPESPGPTNTPTPTPKEPTPEGSPEPTPCSIVPGSRFASLWSSVRDRLGCPTNQAHSTEAADQLFENGYMLWRKDAMMIYVMYNDRNLEVFKDTWTRGVDLYSRGLTPPAGRVEPVSGFGKVWYESLGGPNAVIGWGLEPQKAVFPPDAPQLEVQDFDRGVIFWRDGVGVRVLLLDDKTWQ